MGSNEVVTSTLVTDSVLASTLALEDNAILIIVFEDPPLVVVLGRPSWERGISLEKSSDLTANLLMCFHCPSLESGMSSSSESSS
jgi:hypothetical protein